MRLLNENWIWLAGPLIGAAAALVLGQDANWDLRVYHYYNPWAFLHGRHALDIMPVLNPTYYNPALDLPFYLLAQRLPAAAVGFLLGAVQGLTLPLLYKLAMHLLPEPMANRRLFAGLFAMLGGTGAMTLSQFGATQHDNTLSVLALAGLLAGIVAVERGHLRQAVALPAALGGVAVGLAFGLKLTMALYVLGFGAALMAGLPLRLWLAAGAAATAGMVLGFALGGGYWTWFLWSHYGNPVFPHFNDIFQSPFAGLVDFRDGKFVDGLGWWKKALLPLLMAFDSRLVAESDFRELRPALAFLAVLPALPLLWRADARTRAVLAFAVAAYLAWLWLYCIYRYLLPLEMLAPLIALAGLRAIGLASPLAARLALAASLVAAAFTLYPDPQRVAYKGQFVEVVMPATIVPYYDLVLLAGDQPSGFILPHLPAGRFVKLNDWPYLYQSPDKGFEPIVRKLVAGHSGSMALLTHPFDRDHAAKIAELFGLAMGAACTEIYTNLVPEAFLLCPVARK